MSYENLCKKISDSLGKEIKDIHSIGKIDDKEKVKDIANLLFAEAESGNCCKSGRGDYMDAIENLIKDYPDIQEDYKIYISNVREMI